MPVGDQVPAITEEESSEELGRDKPQETQNRELKNVWNTKMSKDQLMLF